MRDEGSIRSLLNDVGLYAVRGTNRDAYVRAYVTQTALRWVLEEQTFGQLVFALTAGFSGDPLGLDLDEHTVESSQ